MANNRIYLRCKACGKMFFLGKHFCQGWYYTNYTPDKGTLEDKLNAFYDEHIYCKGYPLECLEIEYEDKPEPVTNADKVRGMTDEELARWIAEELIEPGYYTREGAYRLWLDWLKEEIE